MHWWCIYMQHNDLSLSPVLCPGLYLYKDQRNVYGREATRFGAEKHWAAFQLNKQLNKATPCRVLICLTRSDANIRKLWWLDSYWPVDLKPRMSSVSPAGSNALSVSVLLERMCALRHVFYVICSTFHEACVILDPLDLLICTTVTSYRVFPRGSVTDHVLHVSLVHVLIHPNIKPSQVSTVTEAF